MDYMMDARMVYCLQTVSPSTWTFTTWLSGVHSPELSALSLDHNSAAVEFPDFTRGHWNEVKGYKHAYNTTNESAVEAAAKVRPRLK